MKSDFKHILIAICMSLISTVNVVADDKKYDFDIPVLPANLTLGKIAQKSKTSLLLPYKQVEFIKANKVKGRKRLDQNESVLEWLT